MTARNWIFRGITLIILVIMTHGFVYLLTDMQARSNSVQHLDSLSSQVDNATPTPMQTFPPSTPLATLTPSSTLRPPPTFEPPTQTLQPSSTFTRTPPPTFNAGDMQASAIRGLETATPSSTPGCNVREDWQLTYEVQLGDTLTQIADQYHLTVWELAEGNCLSDANIIVSGQKLHVPGNAHPQPGIECVPWEVLTPISNAYNVDGRGQLTFNWRGPAAPRNLIRVIQPDGEIWERVVDLRQNETINMALELPQQGTHTWYVYPLDMNFQQINCHEGGPWTFHSTGAE